jgi:hypothetical protein
MKDVMWRQGQTDDQAGGLEFAQKSRTNFIPMFDFRSEEIKNDIENELRKAPRRVSLFYENWPERPDDQLCESAYRKALLEFEADGRIEVVSKDGTAVAEAKTRRKWKSKPTLGKDYFVRLKCD